MPDRGARFVEIEPTPEDGREVVLKEPEASGGKSRSQERRSSNHLAVVIARAGYASEIVAEALDYLGIRYLWRRHNCAIVDDYGYSQVVEISSLPRGYLVN